MSIRLPTYFLSHGGGPWPWMMEQMPGVFDQLHHSLKAISTQLPSKPNAILVVTSHWVTKDFVVSGHAKPPMIYDYGGFPVDNTLVQYPAPGSPELAVQVFELLQNANLPAHVDYERGFDHGTYTVTQPMYPDASIPVVQLSVQRQFDPALHLQVGRALAPLRDEGVLILGSGLSYHNLGLFGRSGAEPSQHFDRWLNAIVTTSPDQRSPFLQQWSTAPSARTAHPREDHLIPLMVAAGAAESEPAKVIYHEEQFLGGISVSSFRFG